jgi:hypothetical protein
MTSCLCYFPILYVRSPAAFLVDSIFSPPLLPRMADEASYGVRLPARSFHDLGKRFAFGPLHHGDNRGLLVGAFGFRFRGGLLGAARLLRGLGFLARFAGALGVRRIGHRLMFSLSIAFSFIEFLLDRVAVVTVITPLGRNINANLRAIEPMRRITRWR